MLSGSLLASSSSPPLASPCSLAAAATFSSSPRARRICASPPPLSSEPSPSLALAAAATFSSSPTSDLSSSPSQICGSPPPSSCSSSTCSLRPSPTSSCSPSTCSPRPQICRATCLRSIDIDEMMIVEAYAALVLAFLSTESMKVRDAVTSCLPDNSLNILVPVLEKFVTFHLQLNMMSQETHSSITEVIERCKLS
ncbi:unnamed protein product [Urochloa humidicola]